MIAQVNAALPSSGREAVAEEADPDEHGELGGERQRDPAGAARQAGGEGRDGQGPEDGGVLGGRRQARDRADQRRVEDQEHAARELEQLAGGDGGPDGPDGQQGQERELVFCDSSKGMASVSSANVRAPTASQVY